MNSSMRVLLVQLPIPQLGFARQTGNVPLAAAYLKQAAQSLSNVEIIILSESVGSYLGDAALLGMIEAYEPDIIGFTTYCWNVDRSLYMARCLKESMNIKTIFGGPEVTPDNPRLCSPCVDFKVYGEGESVFRKLVEIPEYWHKKAVWGSACKNFPLSSSPYINGYLEPEIEQMMLLETVRGCPFSCGYCFYNKSRRGLSAVDSDLLIHSLMWATKAKIPEVYFLDPCLNIRPNLEGLLKKTAGLNRPRKLNLISETRAELISETMAELFYAAGFTMFEIGLQTTNPKALSLMNRPTDLNKFLEGAKRLQNRDILPRIDLILGLPGDDVKGFKKSLDFIVDHELHDDIQVFALSVLPGTDFRNRSQELGLKFSQDPPYPVIATHGFGEQDFLQALDYAEARLDVSLFPMPALDIFFPDTPGNDFEVKIGETTYIFMVCLKRNRPLRELEALSCRLTHPYQILVPPEILDFDYLKRALELFTGNNPYTPLDIIFLEPGNIPQTKKLLESTKLKRPHYLDQDLRYLFPKAGNRAVLFTLVSEDPTPRFSGDMERQLLWWKGPGLPSFEQIQPRFDMDGILIDGSIANRDLINWQDRYHEYSDTITSVSFSDRNLQNRWLKLISPEEYYFNLRERIF